MRFFRGAAAAYALAVTCAIASQRAAVAQVMLVENENDSTIYRFSLASGNYGANLGLFAGPSQGLNDPSALCQGADGTIYVANAGPSFDGTIRRFAANGTPLGTFATGAGDVTGLTFDSLGRLYATDINDNLIRWYAPDGTSLGVFANSGLNYPETMVFAPDGTLWVTNGGGRDITQYTSSGTLLGEFGQLLNDGLDGLALGADDNFYATNYTSNQILKFNTLGTYKGVFASSALVAPEGLAFGPSGDLYVANYQGDDVLEYTSAGSLVGVFATQNGPRNLLVVSGDTIASDCGTLPLAASGILALLPSVIYRRRR